MSEPAAAAGESEGAGVGVTMLQSTKQFFGESKSSIESYTKDTTDRVVEQARVKKEQVKKDAQSLGQWVRELVEVAVTLYLAGVKDSVLRRKFTIGKDNAKMMQLAKFSALVLIVAVLQDYLYEWLYWALLAYANEILNYAFVVDEFLRSWMAMASTVKDKIGWVKEKVSESGSKIVDSFASLRQRKSPNKGEDAASEKPVKQELSGRERRQLTSKLLAQVIVAKVMSYTLIWAYMQEMVDAFAFVDLPIYVLLLSYFMIETRLLLIKDLNFVQRLDHVKSHLIYHLGFGTVMGVIFMFAPYGEIICSFYHALILCSEPQEPQMDKRFDMDVLEWAEKGCAKVVEYVV